MTTGYHLMYDPVTTPSDYTYCPHALITPTSHNFKPYISFWAKIENCKRNVRLKIVASGCDQCVWPAGVVTGCGHWVGLEQSLMRQHLLECLPNEALTEFPQSTCLSAKPRRSKVSHIVINLFCTCRIPESFDSKIIECDRCAEWFHFKCVGIKNNTILANWIAPCPPDSIIIYTYSLSIIFVDSVSNMHNYYSFYSP